MISVYQEFAQIEWHNKMMFLILLFNIVDFLTTKILVAYGGYEMEANYFLYELMVYFDSVWVILIVKFILIGLAWFVVYRYYDSKVHKVPTISLYTALLVGISISIYNFVGIFTIIL